MVPEFYLCSEIAQLWTKINTVVGTLQAGKKHFAGA